MDPRQVKASQTPHEEEQVAVVVIGRNEGDRLVRCLRSIPAEVDIVYVDSGSTDGSGAMAAKLGIDVVELDASTGFTAARARNAGLSRLVEKRSRSAYVQMIDGDCEVQPGWLGLARDELRRDRQLAGIFGRRRERHPDRSVYNWLCDIEWSIPPGPANGFGGDVMLRRSAVEAVRYPDEMIAGEDTELSIRLRKEGWQVRCVAAEMTLHDAAILSFRQWWRRSMRGGHAMAELSARHFGSRLHDYDRRCLSIIAWGLGWPLVTAAAAAMTALSGGILWVWLLVGALLTILGQLARIGFRETRHHPVGRAFALSCFLIVGKSAEGIGLLQYWWNRFTNRQSRLIEYKRTGQAQSADLAA